MDPLLKKLNYKTPAVVFVLNAPPEFQPKIEWWKSELIPVEQQLNDDSLQFVLVFVSKQIEIESWVAILANQLVGDVVVWIAYPKGTSKRYQCDFNRDTGWESLGAIGFEGVRQVALDEDWSALRFRNATYIKSMTREASRAISKEGKEKLKR